MPPRVIGIIPARYGSTRLPGKALKLIAGKPMIQRVLERCLTARCLNSVWVATDDQRIAHAVEAIGGKAIMTSPHHPSGTDRLAEAVMKLEADIVVNLQGDQPFLDAEMIEEAVQPLLDDPALPMATLMHPVTRPEDFANPAVVKVVVDRAGNAFYFSRSLIPYLQQVVSHMVKTVIRNGVSRCHSRGRISKSPTHRSWGPIRLVSVRPGSRTDRADYGTCWTRKNAT